MLSLKKLFVRISFQIDAIPNIELAASKWLI